MSNTVARRVSVASRARTSGFTLRKPSAEGAQRWHLVYADGVLEERLGTDSVAFNLPCPGRGVYEVRGNTESALVFVFHDNDSLPKDGVRGLVVLISDREAVEHAMQSYLSNN